MVQVKCIINVILQHICAVHRSTRAQFQKTRGKMLHHFMHNMQIIFFFKAKACQSYFLNASSNAFPFFTLQIDWFSMHLFIIPFCPSYLFVVLRCCCFCSVCFSRIFKNMLSSHQTGVMPFVECSLLCNFSTCISLLLAMQNNVQYFYDTFEIFCSAHHSTL